MNSTYNTEEWAAATVLGRQVFNYNYHFSGNEFKGWKLIKVVLLMQSGESTQKTYMFENISNPKHEILRIDVTERYSWDLAQQSLQQNMEAKMRSDIPKGTGDLERIGDVNYVAREQFSDIPAAISFTRGNILLSLNCVGDRNFDVTAIAAQIDDELHKPATKSQLEKEKIKRIKPTSAVTYANEPYVLSKNLKKQFKSISWVKIIVSDGELKRRGDELIYTSSKEGKKTIDIFATDRS